MKVLFTTLLQNQAVNNVKNSTPLKNYSSNAVSLPKLDNDVFVKSVVNVSFKSSIDNKQDKTNIKDTMIGTGVVGAAFLMPLILTTAIAKNQNPDELFTQDGLYIGDATELFVDKNKVSELGFEIDPNRFKGSNCFCDEINGVFKDFNKGIDINLSEGKYIDLNKGIYVNPDDKTSVIFTKGEAIPIILPSFSGAYTQNHSVQIDYPVGSREEFIKEHGIVPEPSDAPWVYENLKHSGLGTINETILATIYKSQGFEPIDRRSILEQTKDFLCGKEDSSYLHDYWGREVVQLFDKSGQSYYVALTDDLSERIHNEHISYETAQAILTHAAEHPIQNYINENYSDKFNNLNFLNPSIEDFLVHTKHNDCDYATETTNESNMTNDDYSNDDIDIDKIHLQDDDIPDLI